MRFSSEGRQSWVRSQNSLAWSLLFLGSSLGLISTHIICRFLTKQKLPGTLDHFLKTSKISDWMADISDDTKLVHMNLPGTHDTCTCKSYHNLRYRDKNSWSRTVNLLLGNYTSETQKSLERYTGPWADIQSDACINLICTCSLRIPDARVYRCQQHSIFQMLNEGIRVFDLRYAYNPGLDTMGFYHCRCLCLAIMRIACIILF